MNPLRLFLQMASSPSQGERLVALTLALLMAVGLLVGAVYGYHYLERKSRKRSRRRRHRESAPERRKLTNKDVEGDVW